MDTNSYYRIKQSNHHIFMSGLFIFHIYNRFTIRTHPITKSWPETLNKQSMNLILTDLSARNSVFISYLNKKQPIVKH